MTVVARPPHTAVELRSLLALRRRVFAASWMASHCRFTTSGLEFDAWDVHAHHLGIWNQRNEPVGVARILTSGVVERSVALMDDLRWPSSGDHARVPALDDFFEDRPGPFLDDRRVLEISRFGLARTVRGRAMATFFARVTCAWALVVGGIRPVVFRVPVRQAPSYRDLVGAERVVPTLREHYGTEVCLLQIRATRLPATHRTRLEHYASVLDAGRPLREEAG